MIKSSETIEKLATALNQAQNNIKGAVKDSQNPYFKSSYANLESVIEALREPLAKGGLSYTQLSSPVEMGEGFTWCAVTRIMHTSGQWIEGYYPIICAKPNDPQAFGAAYSYARRYALSAAFGVAQVDDDAEAAMDRKQPPQRQPAPMPPANRGTPTPQRSSPPQRTQQRQPEPPPYDDTDRIPF